jgi:hypothetical protein
MEDKSTPPWGGPPPQPAGLGSDYGKPRPPECDDDGGMIWPIACIVAFFAFIGSLVLLQITERSTKDGEIASLARQAAASGLPVEACPYDAVSEKVIWVRTYSEKIK